jgi:hypothetical protein
LESLRTSAFEHHSRDRECGIAESSLSLLQLHHTHPEQFGPTLA